MEFTVYTGNGCKYCTLAKLFINANGGKVIEKNVDTSVANFEEHAKTGAMGVPVIVGGGKTFIGFNPQIQQEIAELLGVN
jgi:glutaredoxin